MQDTRVTQYIDKVVNMGKESAHALYPRDFELYMCAFELLNDKLGLVDYFLFPIMPKHITKTETEATTMQTSFSGITVFNKAGYTPDSLTLQGNFGRSFKFLPEESAGYVKALSISEGYYSAESVQGQGVKENVNEFELGVKTGYGCSKILQSIVHKSKAYGQTGKTYRLFFHNPALGESYLVIPTKTPIIWSQDEQSSNMMWEYTINLSIIADMKDVVDYVDTKNSMSNKMSKPGVVSKVSATHEISKKYSDKPVMSKRFGNENVITRL